MPNETRQHRVVCGSVSFHTEDGKTASQISNRYRVGSNETGILRLNPYEALYLFLKGKIRPENPSMNSLPKIVSALELNDDLETFFVFRELKSKGLQLKVHGRTIFYRKKSGGRMHGPIIVIKESETISDIDLARSAGGLYAAIDDDFDITMFLSESFVPIGTNPLDRPGFVEDNMDMTRIVDSQSVPPWMGHDIGGFKVLTNYEISYLTGRARTDPDLEVYNDLVRRGFVVKTGFKYGCNFRAYAGPSSEHAEFLVHVLTGSDQWYKISRAVRVAHGVRKKMLFASKLESGITYTLISRIRDFPEDS